MIERHTHERGKALDLHFLGDDKAAAPLLSGGLADDGDGVLWARTKAVEGARAGRGGRAAGLETEVHPLGRGIARAGGGLV